MEVTGTQDPPSYAPRSGGVKGVKLSKKWQSCFSSCSCTFLTIYHLLMVVFFQNVMRHYSFSLFSVLQLPGSLSSFQRFAAHFIPDSTPPPPPPLPPPLVVLFPKWKLKCSLLPLCEMTSVLSAQGQAHNLYTPPWQSALCIRHPHVPEWKKNIPLKSGMCQPLELIRRSLETHHSFF